MIHLRCENIHKSFGGVCALDAVSLDLTGPGITAIIGPNGAGKTTLLNIVTGYLSSDAGRISFDGDDLTCMAPYQIARRGICRTFQELRLIRGMSVIENVMLSKPRQHDEGIIAAITQLRAGIRRANDQEIATRWLNLVGLESHSTSMAGEMSYGEQKLLSLACCLATDAKILILDEPIAGVHPEFAVRLLGVLRDMRRDQRLVVFIEHDLSAVREVAERLIVMDGGRVIADGVPAEVLDRPEIMEAYVG